MVLIKRKVAVKAIVTEQFKERLVAQLRQALQQVELAQQQLEIQGGKYLSELEDKDPAQGDAFRRKLERQKQKQEAIRAKLTEELAVAEKLELGTEHLQGMLDGLVEVNVGDNLAEKLQAGEILVKDGLVVEVRHG